jgi:hypothetical protein
VDACQLADGSWLVTATCAPKPFVPDPDLGGKGDHYTVFDLLKFVDEMNPIG